MNVFLYSFQPFSLVIYIRHWIIYCHGCDACAVDNVQIWIIDRKKRVKQWESREGERGDCRVMGPGWEKSSEWSLSDLVMTGKMRLYCFSRIFVTLRQLFFIVIFANNYRESVFPAYFQRHHLYIEYHLAHLEIDYIWGNGQKCLY